MSHVFALIFAVRIYRLSFFRQLKCLPITLPYKDDQGQIALSIIVKNGKHSYFCDISVVLHKFYVVFLYNRACVLNFRKKYCLLCRNKDNRRVKTIFRIICCSINAPDEKKTTNRALRVSFIKKFIDYSFKYGFFFYFYGLIFLP